MSGCCISSFPRSAWERREMLNTEKKLLQATNQKLTHARAKILFLKMKVCVPTLEHGNEEICSRLFCFGYSSIHCFNQWTCTFCKFTYIEIFWSICSSSYLKTTRKCWLLSSFINIQGNLYFIPMPLRKELGAVLKC